MKGALSRPDIERLIDTYIVGRNAERDRDIVSRRMLDGVKFESLAEEFDLSVTHTKNIVYKRQDQMFRHIDVQY